MDEDYCDFTVIIKNKKNKGLIVEANTYDSEVVNKNISRLTFSVSLIQKTFQNS